MNISHASAFPTGRAWIELDMSCLRHNVTVLQSMLPDNCQLMPVVKANAYGHGAADLCREFNSYGIRSFCVASVLEGVELRKHGIEGEILVLGYTHPKQFCLLSKYDLSQTIIDCCYALTLNSWGEKIKVHLKIDTGMHRLGERSENIEGIIQIFGYKHLTITGIYTQLCVSDGEREEDRLFTQMQIDCFNQVLTKIKENGYKLPKTHIQSSYGVYKHNGLSVDYARVGISLYGMFYCIEDTNKYGAQLQPVLSVKARISTVKTLLAGESVGYGLTFTAPHDMRYAALSIGYADGIPRCLSCGVGNVLINGKKAPVIGRICMDQMMVDVTEIDNVKQGDTAVIIGKSGNAGITACEIAEQAGTVSPEILSRLGNRLGKVVTYSNLQ